MNRENLLKKLVDRKLASNRNNNITPFCVCMAQKPRSDGGRPSAPPNPRQ